jgi:hypothetical protein
MNFRRAYSCVSVNWRFSVEGIEQKAQKLYVLKTICPILFIALFLCVANIQ